MGVCKKLHERLWMCVRCLASFLFFFIVFDFGSQKEPQESKVTKLDWAGQIVNSDARSRSVPQLTANAVCVDAIHLFHQIHDPAELGSIEFGILVIGFEPGQFSDMGDLFRGK